MLVLVLGNMMRRDGDGDGEAERFLFFIIDCGDEDVNVAEVRAVAVVMVDDGVGVNGGEVVANAAICGGCGCSRVKSGGEAFRFMLLLLAILDTDLMVWLLLL